MKKSIWFVCLLFVVGLTFASEKDRVIELGVTTTRPLYDTYNVMAKIGDDHSVLRIGSISASDYMYWQSADDIDGNDTLISNLFYSSNSVGFAIGREIRKDLKDNFELRYGLDFTFALNQRKYEDVRDTLYTVDMVDYEISPGFRFVLGMNYVLKDKIVFGIEVLPKLYFNYLYSKRSYDYADASQDDRSDIQKRYLWRFDFSSIALLSISYRF